MPNCVWNVSCASGSVFDPFPDMIISGVITFILMAVCVDIIKMNEYLAWLLTSAFNLIFNYVASKFYIFKKS